MYQLIGTDRFEYGPIDAAQIHHWIREGRVNEQTLVKEAGSSQWKLLCEIPEFAAALGTRPKPPVAALPPKALAPGTATEVNVPNYLLWAILTTLLCCPPVGIPAIYYSVRVDKQLKAGDVEGARAASKNARLWCWICLIAGVLFEVAMLWGLQWVLKGNLAEGLRF